MGNSTNSFNQNFLNDWVQIDRFQPPQSDRIVWAKKKNKDVQMEEYSINFSSKEQLQQEQRIHFMRQNHPQLVSSLHFIDETEEQFCASNYKGKLFIQRIPLTLQTINDIPFPDALHIYSQSLQGFHLLTNEVESGCFPISEQNIGINCDSICKVWMNSKFNRNYPNRNEKITEERMVKNILDTIQENVDLGSLENIPSPMQYIYTKARAPSEVKFGQAINLLRNYANQFFGGVIPQRLICVDKVGGSMTLLRNWLSQKSQIIRLTPQFIQGQAINYGTQAVNSYPQQTYINTQPQPYPSENYTIFRREEPIQRGPIVNEVPPYGQGSFIRNVQPIQQSIIPPQFQGNVIQSSQVKPNSPVPFPITSSTVVTAAPSKVVNVATIPQVVRNEIVNVNPVINEVKRSQFGSRVQPVVQTKPIPSNFVVFNSPKQQLRQNLINSKVQQVTSQKGIIIQPLTFTQNRPVPVNYPVNVQKQSIILPVIQQQINQIPVAQQVINQVSSEQKNITQIANVPQIIGQVPIIQQQNIQTVKKSTIAFNNQGQVYQTQSFVQTSQIQTRKLEEQEIKTFQKPDISNSQLQKVNSKLVFIDKTSPARFSEKQQDKKKQASPQYKDYSSSYYAFTNKLYDKQESSPKNEIKIQTFKNTDYTSGISSSIQPQKQSVGKYSVKLDDGMSSPDFLNQLKNMNIGSTSKASDSKYDFSSSYSSYLNKDYGSPINYDENKYQLDRNERAVASRTFEPTVKEETELYKVDYKDYTATLTDGVNHDNDLIVVGSKIDLTPLQTNQNKQLYIKFRQTIGDNSYRVSYQYQEGETPSGNLHYTNQVVQMENKNQTYQQQYFEQTDYQSIFDKYASLPNKQLQTQFPTTQQLKQQFQTYHQNLGENIDTQYTLINADQQQAPEQYKVDFDPEILADLERLKGVN